MQIIDVNDLPDSARYDQIRNTPPDKVIISEKAHCSLWWKNTPQSENKNGLIGQFYAESKDAAHQILKAAEGFLRDKGCEEVIGPMDGNTWKPYRLLAWSDNSPPFFMEPENPPAWPGYWQSAGFEPYHEYLSSVISSLEFSDPRLPRTKERLTTMAFGIYLASKFNLHRFFCSDK